MIEAVVSDPALAGWDGFGIAVQAYGPRALPVIDWIYDLVGTAKRRLMVRLVKGAYWDTEIKLAQVQGVDGFPVFTSKPATDISYIANARKLLGMTDRIYPQFATHNAHTVAAILDMASVYMGTPKSRTARRATADGRCAGRAWLESHRQRRRAEARVQLDFGLVGLTRAPDDQRILEQPALFEVLDQRRGRPVGGRCGRCCRL